MRKALLFFTVVASVFVVSSATVRASDGPVPLCSDPGRACSVDRNCCSGSCVHGNCK